MTTTTTEQTQQTTPATGPEGAAPPEAKPAEQQTQAPTNGSKVVQIPQNAFTKLKREEREKGQAALAKELGYESVDAMKQALARGGRNGNGAGRDTRGRDARPGNRPAQPPAAPAADTTASATGASARQVERLARERAELDEKNKRLARDKARQEKANRDLRRTLDRKEAETELKIAAMRAGVQDVDYALHLVQRHVAGKTAAELEGFDEGRFFTDLRKSHAYLFAETSQPATTGNAGGADARPPVQKQPGAVNNGGAANGANGPRDARKMTREEFDKTLAERGLHNPNGSPSY